MATTPTRIASRLAETLKRFQPIVESARKRDINESDTVVLMTGILSESLGFDKYSDITTEYAIRGTYCDLALKVDGKIKILMEAKAIGIELRDQHVKQAVDYAANKGLEWVILSNAVTWKIFKVVFSKPIQHYLVAELNFLDLNHKNQDDIDKFYIICKEAIAKNSLEDYFIQKQATNKFMVGNLLTGEAILNQIRKDLRMIYPDIKVNLEEINQVLQQEVIKREILDGEEADEARRKILRSNKKKEKMQSRTSTTIIASDVSTEVSQEASTIPEVSAEIEMNPQQQETPLPPTIN
jgi:predicted type IV restriction endonuclease